MPRSNTATPLPPDTELDPNEVESAWVETIERRLAEVREGKVKPVPSEDVFAALDDIVRQR